MHTDRKGVPCRCASDERAVSSTLLTSSLLTHDGVHREEERVRELRKESGVLRATRYLHALRFTIPHGASRRKERERENGSEYVFGYV